MVFPNDLIQQCLALVLTPHDKLDQSHDHEHENEHEPGELLQLVLSVLAQTTTTTTTADSSTSTTSSAPQTIYQIITDATNNDNDNDTQSLVTAIQTQTSSTTYDTWHVGLQLIALLLKKYPGITAFEVHAAAMQSVYLNDVPGKSTTTNDNSDHHSHYLFWTLICLLCCWSLEKCRDDILVSQQQQPQQHITKPPKPIRWKRIKSLLLETIQLYQRHALFPAAHDDNDNEMDEDQDDMPSPTYCPSSLSIPLWVEYVAPVCQSLWYEFPPAIRPVDSLFWPATAISVATHLAAPQSSSASASSLQDQVWMLKLVQSLHQIDHLSWDEIWCHPWRVASHHQQQQQQEYNPRLRRRHYEPCHSSLDWWTLQRSSCGSSPKNNDLESDNDNDDQTSHASSIPVDDYEGIETSWHELGLACLAHLVWEMDAFSSSSLSASSSSSRPLVYTAWYEWRLWFPHVPILMDAEQHHDSNHDNNKAASLECIVRGIAFLQNLLPILPSQSLRLHTSFSLMESSTTRNNGVLPLQRQMQTGQKQVPLPPDHPVRTFQLLFSVMVSGLSTPSSSTARLGFPSAMQVFHLCKVFLSKYTSSCQLEIVLDHLLPTCPDPGLKPKILDLLRPLLVTLKEDLPKMSTQEKQVIRKRLRASLDDILSGLVEFCDFQVPPKQIQQEAKATVRSLCNVDHLIDQAELFVSACAMVQLEWTMLEQQNNGPDNEPCIHHPRTIVLRRPDDDDKSRVVTLQEFHSALQTQLGRWNEATENGAGQNYLPAPDQFFRISLLDDALQQLVNLS